MLCPASKIAGLEGPTGHERRSVNGSAVGGYQGSLFIHLDVVSSQRLAPSLGFKVWQPDSIETGATAVTNLRLRMGHPYWDIDENGHNYELYEILDPISKTKIR